MTTRLNYSLSIYTYRTIPMTSFHVLTPERRSGHITVTPMASYWLTVFVHLVHGDITSSCAPFPQASFPLTANHRVETESKSQIILKFTFRQIMHCNLYDHRKEEQIPYVPENTVTVDPPSQGGSSDAHIKFIRK